MAKRTQITRTLTSALLASAVFSSAIPAYAQSPIRDQDQSAYNTLYRDKLDTVERTRTIDDDLTLAREMFAFAKEVPGDVGVQCLIYLDVINLAANGADLTLMHQALTQLETLWPGQDALSSEQLMQLASRAYRAVDRNNRIPQGEAYIDLLLIVADRYEAQSDLEQTIGVCRLASTIARSIESKRSDTLLNKLAQLDAANEMAKRIKMLALSVEKNPQNSPAARELVRLLITQQNDLQTAATYVQSTSDEELIDLVQRCAKGMEQATAATAQRAGDWYVALAEGEKDQQAVFLLEQARQWYQQFFLLYRRDDALAKRVQDMDSLVMARIERLLETNPELKDAEAAKGKWVALTGPDFKALDHVFGPANNIQVNNQGRIGLSNTAVMIPYKPGKAYEIRITLTVHADAEIGNPAINVHLPVGDGRILTTRYYVNEYTIANVDAVVATKLIEPAPAQLDQKTQLTFQLAESRGSLAYVMLYNGKPGVKWTGELTQLQPLNDERTKDIPEPLGPVLIIEGIGTVSIHLVEYREH